MIKLDKKKKLILLGIIILVVLSGLSVVVVSAVNSKKRVVEEDLVIFWEMQEMQMNVGEYRVLKWESNKDVVPFVFSEQTAVSISAVNDREVVLKAFQEGLDTVTLQAENQVIVCVVKVIGDVFRFENEDAVIGVGAAEIFYIKVEPQELLEVSRINYSIENREVAKIKEADNNFIEILGLRKGLTYVNAEWRGKNTGFMLEVIDDLYRSIIVPKEKQFLFVGQETSIKVFLDEVQRGDEYGFKYFPEKDKNVLAVVGENDILKIKALREGEQSVRVTHPKAKSAKVIFFDVIPSPDPEPPRIETSESPMIIGKDERKYLYMHVVNGSGDDANNFTYRIIENSYAVEISQNKDKLWVKGIAPGAAKIRISNSVLTKEYDVMIIVE